MKKIFLAIVVALFGFAANAQPTGLVGTWKSTTMDILGDNDAVLMSADCGSAGMEMEFTFNSDKTVTGVVISGGNREESPEMGYLVKGNDILVISEEEEMMPFRYENGKLFLIMREDGMNIRINFIKK